MWLKEGIAVHVGCLESTAFRTMKDLCELETWISQNQSVPGRGNPITIHQHADIPAGADMEQYYRLFEVATRYLLDSNGSGRSFRDVLSVFYDLRQGMSFSSSFENHFGMSVNDYEAEFYD